MDILAKRAFTPRREWKQKYQFKLQHGDYPKIRWCVVTPFIYVTNDEALFYAHRELQRHNIDRNRCYLRVMKGNEIT